MPTFQERLNEALLMRDMSPSELSRITGIGEGAISQYRKGAYKASQRNLEKIANALSVSIPWLMGVSDDTKTSDIPRADKTAEELRALLHGTNTAVIMTKGENGQTIIELSSEEAAMAKTVIEAMRKQKENEKK